MIVAIWNDPTGAKEDEELLGLFGVPSIEYIEQAIVLWRDMDHYTKAKYHHNIIDYLSEHDYKILAYESVTIQGAGK